MEGEQYLGERKRERIDWGILSLHFRKLVFQQSNYENKDIVFQEDCIRKEESLQS